MKFLTKEERKSKTSLGLTLPKDTARKTEEICKKFMTYIEERGECRELVDIPAEELDEMLASFWSERRKQNGSLHDIGSLNGEFSRLASYIYKTTLKNPTTHPAFVEYRETKEEKLKQSKQQLGNLAKISYSLQNLDIPFSVFF